MFTERTRTRIAAAAVIGGLALIVVLRWEGWDGRHPKVTDPRVVAEATTDGITWTVIHVHEADQDDCLYLRQDGVTLDRTCNASGILRHYQVGIRTLRGGTTPVFFGMLPPTAARAEATPGVALRDRIDLTGSVPLQVRSFGETGRFVIQPVPGEPIWSGADVATVLVHDPAGRPMTP
jgi:hypothetical protein